MSYHFDGTPFSQRKKKKKEENRSSKKTTSTNATTTNAKRADGEGKARRVDSESPSSSSSPEAEDAHAGEAAENTFNLGRDATAEILRMSAVAAASGRGVGDGINDTSVLSIGSRSSVASSAADGDDDAVDALNCTTMSDTHELSTSNFIQNARMRNLLADRARALYGTAATTAARQQQQQRQQPSGAGEDVDEATLTLPDLTLNLTGWIPPPSSLGVDRPPPDAAKLGQQPPTPSSPTRPRGGRQKEQQRPAGGVVGRDGGGDDDDDDDGTFLEFASSHRGTARKEGGPWGGEITTTNINLTRLIEESSRMMAEDYSLEEEEEEEEEEGGGEESGRRAESSSASRNGLDFLLGQEEAEDDEGDEGDEAEGESSYAESGKLRGVQDTDSSHDATGGLRMGNSSFVESTASLDDLNYVLDDGKEVVPTAVGHRPSTSESTPSASRPAHDDSTKGLHEGNSSFVESTASLDDLNYVLDDGKEVVPTAVGHPLSTSESTPSASRPANDGGGRSTTGSLCPSPSFLSGKKSRGSIGVAMLRKSLGGDLSEIHRLTASLRKEKKKNASRMSLPALAMARDRQHSHLQKTAADDADGANLHPPPAPPRRTPPSSPLQDDKLSPPPRAGAGTSPSKIAGAARSPPPPEKTDSPAKNTRRNASRKSPSKVADGAGMSPSKKAGASLPPPPEVLDSPAKNTRKNASRKSPSKAPPSAVAMMIDSPGRNTRGAAAASRRSPSRKSSTVVATASVDSPARNTRGAAKAKSPSLPPVSPSSKSMRAAAAKRQPAPLSPTAAASPARSTRGANNRKDASPRHSSAACSSSPARSLFNSPSDIDIFQEIGSKLNCNGVQEPTSERIGGPFSGRKRRSIGKPASSASAVANDESEPPRKRMSTSPELSERSMTSMLEAEYPFLSLSPNNADNTTLPTESYGDSSSTASMLGTQTLAFDDFMQGIGNEVTKPTEKNIALLEGDKEEDDSEEIVFNTKHSRKKRRETADTTELMGIFSDAVQDDTSPKATAATEKGNIYPNTPSAASGMAPKTPKSILSSAKQRGTRLRKNVEFGSPEVAEYNINSPSVSMTQMHPESIRERWAIPANLRGEGEGTTELEGDIERLIAKGNDTSVMMDTIDEQTTELEGDLERLIARGSDTSVMMDTIDELGSSKDTSRSSGEGMSFAGEERTEDLETNILHLVQNSAEDSAFSLPSISSVTSASSRQAGESSNDFSRQDSFQDMSMAEQTQTAPLEGTVASLVDGRRDNYSKEWTQTMELEGTLTSLLGGRENTSTLAGEETHTIHLEGTLASLFENRPGRETDLEITLPSLASTSTPPMRNNGQNRTDCESQQMNLKEQDDDYLLQKRNDNSESGEDDTFSVSDMVIANHNLRNGADKRHVPREDDTISELGMNTASHTLRHGKELLIGFTEKFVDTTPEPVDLELDEVVEVGDIDWERMVESQSDIFLKALGTASPKTFPLVKDEAEKIFAEACDEIESQLEDVDDDFQFRAIIENNQDLMRSLQQRLRAEAIDDGDHDIKGQARLLLQAQIEVQFTELNQWLTNAANVYNSELLNNVIPALDKAKADISGKSCSIDQSREKIALPLLIRSAKRATKMNFERTKCEISSCEEEVSELEANVEDAERQLNSLQSMQRCIQKVAESNEKAEALRTDEKVLRATADSSYYKFFSIERLHNWILTGSSDTSISLLFRGPSSETSIQLSFSISASSAVSLNVKVGDLPRSANDFLSVACGKQTRFHPAVSVYFKSKMDLLCKDMKSSRIQKPSDISSMIHCAELRVARIEGVAKELDAILGRCKSSFLQPSDSVKDGYDFTAHLSTSSRKTDRLHMILTIPDCYPFAPIGLHLHSSSSSFDAEPMSRKLKAAMKPGFGALTRAVDAVQSMLK